VDAPLDQPTTIRSGEELNVAALEAYLLEHVQGANGKLSVQQFPRGFSNLTYLLRLGTLEMVLRRPPFGVNIKSAHDMNREYRILSRLRPVYDKVPRTLAYCDDEAVIGAPFYVMERLQGVILRTKALPGMTPDTMRQTSIALVDALVELHALDYEKAGLGDLGKPEGYVSRQVSGWTQRYDNARTDDIPGMERAISWLAANLPPESGAALIHNDFKYDNLMLDPHDLSRVIAVLDWEMATLGDPLMDLGTTLGYWAQPDDPPGLKSFGLTSLPGNLTRRELVDLYAAKTGHDVSSVVFYFVFGMFKVGVIMQQIYERYKKGLTRDPRFGGLIELVRETGTKIERATQAGEI
jgi:aminoglycoside phosphotransferase (APT) family kinase protein